MQAAPTRQSFRSLIRDHAAPVFPGMTARASAALVRYAELRACAPGQALRLHTGADALMLFLVAGSLRRDCGGSAVVDTHWRGDVVDLDAFADGRGGHVGLRALSGGAEVLVLRSSALRALREALPEAGRELEEFVTRHRHRQRLAEILRAHLPSLDEEAIRAVARCCRIVRVPADVRIGTDEDEIDRAWFLLSGRLEECTGNDPRARRRHGPGVLGDVHALRAPSRARVRVRAVRPSEIAVLHRRELLRAVGQRPEIIDAILRLAGDGRAPVLVDSPTPAMDAELLAVIRLRSMVSSAAVARRLEDACGNDARVALFDGTRGLEASGSASLAGELAQWQRLAGNHHDRMICALDERDGGAVEQVLREADRVLFVAPAAVDTTSSRSRRHLWQNVPRPRGTTHLVVVHDADEQQATSWPATAFVDHILRVRAGADEDWSRAARIVTGRARALVLTGADARALAGLGVVAAFEAQGRSFDIVAGVGAGTGIAGLLVQAPATDRALATLQGTLRKLCGWRAWRRRVPFRRALGRLLEQHASEEVASLGWRPWIALRPARGERDAIVSLEDLVGALASHCEARDIVVVKQRRCRQRLWQASTARRQRCVRTGVDVVEVAADERVSSLAALRRTVASAQSQMRRLLEAAPA